MNSIFNDYEGNTSSMNFVWTFSILCVLGLWVSLTYKLGELQHYTMGDSMMITSLFAGKVLQSFFEKKSPIPIDPNAPGPAPGTSLLQNAKGNFDFARFVWIGTVVGIMSTWVIISWKNQAIAHFDTGDAAWFSALFGSKVGQTYVERGGLQAPGDGDSDEDEGEMLTSTLESTNGDTDKLIKQLQDTITVQTEFNKNLIDRVPLREE